MPPLPLPLSSLQKPGKAWALGSLGALPAVVVLWVLCLIKRIRVPNLCQARSRQTCWGIHAFKVVKWQLSNELGQWYISAKYYFQLRLGKKQPAFLPVFLTNTFFSSSLKCLLTPIEEIYECFFQNLRSKKVFIVIVDSIVTRLINWVCNYGRLPVYLIDRV